MKVHIVMRSGAVVTFRAEKITTKRDYTTDSLGEIAWEGATGAPTYLNVRNVDAVYTEREPEDADIHPDMHGTADTSGNSGPE